MANTVIAQGAPNSLVRHIQEFPLLAVDVLDALRALVADAEEVARNSYATGTGKNFDDTWCIEDPEQFALIERARRAIAALVDGAD